MGELKKQLHELTLLAGSKGVIIYNIGFRHAGVGIMWYEENRVTTTIPENISISRITKLKKKQMDEGLVVHQYYKDLETCINEEIKRLKKLPDREEI